jgi:branched-chain amino acid transport system substrate-binding protein
VSRHATARWRRADPETRDIVQPIYIRKVEKINGELWNTEFAKFDDVKDPLKAKK